MKRDGGLQREIIRLSFPMAFQQFMLALVGASDAVMLGGLSQDAMSAVSLATQVTFVFNLFMTAFVIGENMFVAQYYGRKDYENISKVLGLVLGISCVVAVIFWIGTFAFEQSIMRFLTNERELVALGSEYLRIIGVSYVFSAVAQVYMAAMKNCGAVNKSTLISSVTVIMNIILNAVFIFGLSGVPAMGIRGAAWATVISTAVQFVWSAAYIRFRMKPLRMKPLKMKPLKMKPFKIEPFQIKSFTLRPDIDMDLLRRFWNKTAPVLLNELVWGGGFSMYSVILGHMGTDAVAANGIANISKNLIVCLSIGLGSAGSIIVGNRLGGDRFEEAREAGRTLTGLSVWCGVLSGLCLLILSPVIIRCVKLTPQAQEYLQGMFIICAYYLIGKSVNSMTIGGIFPAGGDARFGLLCDALTLWCITIPLGCLCAFVFKFNVLVVYFVLNLDEIVKLPVVYWHYRKYDWVKNII